MSSKDLKVRFDSQFWRMYCQMFSWLLSSGERGGRGKSEMLAVPSGLIKQDDGVSAGSDLRCDLVEMKLHRFGVAEGEHKGGASSMFWAYRTKQIGRLGALIVISAWTRTLSGPAISEFVLLPDPHFVLEPNLYRGARGERLADLRHAGGKVFFLNSSIFSASCL
jgi:hypothetical protein